MLKDLQKKRNAAFDAFKALAEKPTLSTEEQTEYETRDASARHGIDLKVVKLPEAKRGFVLLPRRWVVERSFAWATRFRRLVKDYERYAETLAGLHLVAFATIMSKQAISLIVSS